MHTHDTWTLLIVDDGVIRYDLHHCEHGASRDLVTLLPPHVPHNGRSAIPEGFRKRVIYLDSSQLDDGLVHLAVNRPVIRDPALRYRIHQLHQALEGAGEEFEAESRLALVADRLTCYLHNQAHNHTLERASVIADQLRDLLDARFCEKFTLQEISGILHANPAHLVRAFSRNFGISPHQYVIGRRMDLARKLLLQGMAPRTAAVAVGFYDQAHLSRHFKHVLGISPGRFARSEGPAGHQQQAHLASLRRARTGATTCSSRARRPS
jgi:AraC-like DNA-binding protein